MNILCCIEITCRLPTIVCDVTISFSVNLNLSVSQTIVGLIPEPAMASSFSIQMVHLAIRLMFNILSPGPSHFYLQDLEPRQAAAASPSLLQNFTFTFAYFIRNTELDRYTVMPLREKKSQQSRFISIHTDSVTF